MTMEEAAAALGVAVISKTEDLSTGAEYFLTAAWRLFGRDESGRFVEEAQGTVDRLYRSNVEFVPWPFADESDAITVH